MVSFITAGYEEGKLTRKHSSYLVLVLGVLPVCYYICHRKVPCTGLVLSYNFWSLSPVALSVSANAHDPVAALIAGTGCFLDV
jgi:hypothetical protein